MLRLLHNWSSLGDGVDSLYINVSSTTVDVIGVFCSLLWFLVIGGLDDEYQHLCCTVV